MLNPSADTQPMGIIYTIHQLYRRAFVMFAISKMHRNSIIQKVNADISVT